ncbi:MAG: SusC/RagA family TonB-linked outer membrane protein, partial [Bacteroidota bacterium]
MKKIALMLFGIAMVGMLTVEAQVRRITGTVTSSEDESPIPGVSVLVKGTTVGTVTNIDGFYQLDVPADAEAIVFSFIGLRTVEKPIEGSTVNAVMESDFIGVDEVVVVAYGTAKKESFTGSAEVINTDKLERRTVANVSKALDGMAPGIQTTSGSGQPGSSSSVVIRGFGSINASTSPLYVVDGIPYDGNISSISPNDIASITVLKDASAGALYGSRGANGVIMITTNKGESGETKYNIKANWGVSSRAIPRYETMDERGYLETIFQSYKNEQILDNGLSPDRAGQAALEAMGSGAKRIFGSNQMYNPFDYPVSELIDPATGQVRSDASLRYDEDWLDEVTAKDPLRQEYIFTASGSKDKTKYRFSMGYLNEEGLLRTTGFERFTGRVNVETEGADWFEAGLNTNFALSTSNTSATGTTASSNVFYSAQLMGPIFPVYERDEEGNVQYDALGNPVFDYGQSRPTGASANFNSVATLFEDKYGSNSDNVSGRTFMNFGDTEEGVLKGLKLSLNFGFDYVNRNGLTYYNPNFGNAANTQGYVSKTSGRTLSYTLNQLVTWNRNFGKHSFDLLAGHEFYANKYNYLSGTKTGFPFGGLFELDAATSITGARSYEDNYTIESFLSRANYDYDDKYYFSVSYRTDGSSRFHEDFRWGQFWSVGGNWRISQENFMSGYSWLDNFSLKASYGVQGNDDLRDGDGNTILYAWQAFYDLGWPNANMSGAAVSSLENTDLKWEQNKNFNTGFEATLFERLNITVEWYQRTTEDMLMEYPIASSLGFDSYLKNIGSMRNKGFDISVGGSVINARDFRWNMSLMGATVNNEVLELADKPEIISGSYIIREGEPLRSFYVSKAAGVDPATGAMTYRVYDEDEDGNRDYYLSTDVDKATASKEIMGSRIPDIYGS